MLSHHVVAVRGDEAHGGHQLDCLEHDEGDGGGDGPGQQGQRLLVVEQVPQPDLVVQTLDALQQHSVPLRVTESIWD